MSTAENLSPEFLAQDRRSGTIISVSICSALALLSFILRLTSRRMRDGGYIISDILALGGLACALVISFIVINNARLGVGLHIQRVSMPNIRTILLTSFIGEKFYGLGFTLLKLSLLLLYRRIFVSRLVQVGSSILSVFVICWGIAFLLVSTFDCHPIHGYWDIMIHSKCLDQAKFYIGFSVPNMVADLLMMLLPLRDVMKLQVTMRAKVCLLLLFALAGLVIVASGLRIHFMLAMNPADETWTYVGVALWTAVEMDIAVMCTCLPTAMPAVSWCISGVFTLTKSLISGSKSTHDESSYGRGTSFDGSRTKIPIPSRDGESETDEAGKDGQITTIHTFSYQESRA